MLTPEKLVTLAVTSALIAALAPAPMQAANVFGHSLSELSDSDREALERAQREVLETMKPGTIAVWKDETTGHSGEARLVRSYERNGMPCGEVEHVFRIPGVSRFTMPLCRASDGTWRVAF
jgi:surface antigen